MHHRTLFACVLFTLFCLLPQVSIAQKYGNIWYLGGAFGFDFNTGTRTVMPDDRFDTRHASVSIADPNTGQLLFYSNGIRIWNRASQPMRNSDGLIGEIGSTINNRKNNSPLIVPDPGDAQRFYYLTRENRSRRTTKPGVYYSTIDMRLDNGYGGVVLKNRQLLETDDEGINIRSGLYHEGTIGLTATRHVNGRDYWIVAYVLENGENYWYAWLVSPTGIAEPVVTPVGARHTSYYHLDNIQYHGGSVIHFSPNGEKIVAPYHLRETPLEAMKLDIFLFDPQSGVVSEPIPIDYGTLGFYSLSHFAFDDLISFSPDNCKLYIGGWNGTDSTGYLYTTLIQMSVREHTFEAIHGSMRAVPVTDEDPRPFLMADMQCGPDGRLYFVYYHNFVGDIELWLGVVENPTAPAAELIIQPFTHLLYKETDAHGFYITHFPTMIESWFYQPGECRDLPPDTICQGEEIEFRIPWPLPEDFSIEWSLPGGTPSFSTDTVVTVTYPQSGTFPVTAIIRSPQTETEIQIGTVVVQPPAFKADAGKDTAICVDGIARLRASGGRYYRWSSSEEIACDTCLEITVAPTERTEYIVEVREEMESKCVVYDTVVVDVLLDPIVEMMPDTAICDGETLQLSAHREPGQTGLRYRWSPAADLDCDTCASPRARPHATTTYRVVVANAAGCEAIDSVTIEVRPGVMAVVSDDVTICAGDSVRLRAEGGVKYRWLPASSLDCDTCANVLARPIATTTYHVAVMNEYGCSALDSVTVTVMHAGKVVITGSTAFCSGDSTQLSASGADSYEWSPADGLSCTDCASPIARPAKTTTYYAIGTNTNGECPALDSVTVTVHDLPQIRTGPDTALCMGESIELSVTGGSTYRWQPSQDLSCLDCPDPVARPIQTTTYYVTGTNPEGCEARDSVHVVVHPALVISAGDDRSICVDENVRLSAIGGIRWLWEPSQGLSCTDCPDPIAAPNATTTYRVTAWSAEGCTATDEITVSVRTTPEVIPLSIARTYRTMSGKPIEIRVEMPNGSTAATITGLEFALEYDATMMTIDTGSIRRLLEKTVLAGWHVSIVEEKIGRIVVRLTAPAGSVMHGSGDLLRFESRLFLSSARGTEMPFQVTASNPCVTFTTESGYAQVDSVCGLNFRLIELTASKYAAPRVSPNPAHDRVRFEFALGLDGRTRLEVFDASGNRVGLIVDETLPSGGYAVEWNVGAIPSGLYWYCLTSGDWSVTGQVVVEQ